MAKEYDFSAFDDREVAATPTEPKIDEYSMLDSGVRGAAQGVSFGLADELEGAVNSPMGAGKALLGLLGMDNSADEDVQAYTSARDEARAEYEAAEAQNPGSYLTGNLLSGLIPGAAVTKLVGPAAKGLSLASGVAGPLNKAKATQNIWNATKAGALGGAALSAGMSEAELSKGDATEEFAGDIVKGGLLGGGLGGGIQTGVEGGKAVLSGGSKLLNMLGKTETAQNIKKAFGYGKEGIDVVSKEGLEQAGDNVVAGAGELGLTAQKIYKNAGKAMREAKNSIRESGKAFNIKEQIDQIDEMINQLKKSDDPQALKDIQKLTEFLDNLRLGKVSDVEFTPLNTKTVKEASSTVFDQLPVNKVKGSFENSPEGKLKAQNILAKLTAKAEQEGSDAAYELVDDLDNGFYHVVERSTKQIEQQIPGSTTSKFVPGATKTTQVRSGGTNLEEASIDKVQDVINTLNRYSGVSGGAGEVGTTPAISTLKQVAGKLKNDITEIPELGAANKQSNSAYQALETLGLGMDDFIKDAQTGEMRLTQQASDKLTNLVRKTGTDTSSSITADKKLTEALRLLGGADKAAADTLAPKLEKAADVLDLSQKAQNLKFFKSSFLEKLPIRGGNKLGLTMKSMREKNPEFWSNVGKTLESMGGTKARVGKFFTEVANKDDQARNAMLFSLQQQPWAREVLDEMFDKEEVK
jgi:hypothetical protein